MVHDDEFRTKRAALSKIIAEEHPAVLKILAQAGLSVKDVLSIKSALKGNETIIHVLIDLMGRNYSGRTKELLARSLGSRDCRSSAWPAMISLYGKTTNSETNFKDGIAAAISEMALPSDIGEIASLISDEKNGPSRLFFVSNLSRSRSPEARDALERLATDTHLKLEIAHVFSRKARYAARSASKK